MTRTEQIIRLVLECPELMDKFEEIASRLEARLAAQQEESR